MNHWLCLVYSHSPKNSRKREFSGTNFSSISLNCFKAFYATEEETINTIKDVYNNYNYLIDPHTAVAYGAYQKHQSEYHTLIISTASPYKFAASVLPAVYEGELPADEFSMVEKLSSVTSTPIPTPLKSLQDKEVLHTSCIDKKDMAQFITEYLANRLGYWYFVKGTNNSYYYKYKMSTNKLTKIKKMPSKWFVNGNKGAYYTECLKIATDGKYIYYNVPNGIRRMNFGGKWMK